jgi:uncharacterized protein YacL (UPF0231 family)
MKERIKSIEPDMSKDPTEFLKSLPVPVAVERFPELRRIYIDNAEVQRTKRGMDSYLQALRFDMFLFGDELKKDAPKTTEIKDAITHLISEMHLTDFAATQEKSQIIRAARVLINSRISMNHRHIGSWKHMDDAEKLGKDALEEMERRSQSIQMMEDRISEIITDFTLYVINNVVCYAEKMLYKDANMVINHALCQALADISDTVTKYTGGGREVNDSILDGVVAELTIREAKREGI